MADKKKDGSAAFPMQFLCGTESGGLVDDGQQMGLTLRDYFAAKFASAWVVALSRRRQEAGYDDKTAAIEANRLGLMQADAMLEARTQ